MIATNGLARWRRSKPINSNGVTEEYNCLGATRTLRGFFLSKQLQTLVTECVALSSILANKNGLVLMVGFYFQCSAKVAHVHV